MNFSLFHIANLSLNASAGTSEEASIMRNTAALHLEQDVVFGLLGMTNEAPWLSEGPSSRTQPSLRVMSRFFLI